MIELRFFRTIQHQSHAAAIEECQPGRRLEQQLQPQYLFVEIGRALHVVSGNLNLSQARDSDAFFCESIHRLDLRLQIS